MTERQLATQHEAASNPAWTYENYMVPTLFGPWAERLLEAAAPRAGERVLDVGCGTGVVTRAIARRLDPKEKVVGLDLSPNMLAVARRVAEQEGLNIEWHEGQVEDLPFPNGSFDLVTSQFALMFFADRQKALTEIHRVLAKDGRLVLNVWQSLDHHPFYKTLHEVIERRLGMSGVADIFSLGNSVELRELLDRVEFQRVDVESASMTMRFPGPDSFLAGEIDVDTAAIPSMQRLDAAERRRITEAIREEMEAPLRDVTQDEHVVLPFHAYLVSAKR